MAGLSNYDCEGTLSIGGIAMNRAAFTIQGDDNGNGGLSQFLTVAEQRGEDRILPGSTGVIANRRRVTVTRLSLRLVVVGDILYSGVVQSDPKAGLMTNLKYIYDNVAAPTGATDGTRAIVLALPGGWDATGALHVVRMDMTSQQITTDGAQWEGQLGVSIPVGRFTFS